MKKTFVTLVAAATLVAAVAPVATAVLANDNVLNAYQTKQDTALVNLSLDVARKVVVRDEKRAVFNAASEEVVGREATLSATIIDVNTATADLGKKAQDLKDLQKLVLDLKASVKAGVTEVVGTYGSVEGVDAVYEAELKAAETAVRGAETTLKNRNTAKDEAEKDLVNAQAKKQEAFNALAAAQAELDAAVAAYYNAGGKTEGLPTGATAAATAEAAKPAANTVKPAATPAGTKALPKTSAVK